MSTPVHEVEIDEDISSSHSDIISGSNSEESVSTPSLHDKQPLRNRNPRYERHHRRRVRVAIGISIALCLAVIVATLVPSIVYVIHDDDSQSDILPVTDAVAFVKLSLQPVSGEMGTLQQIALQKASRNFFETSYPRFDSLQVRVELQSVLGLDDRRHRHQRRRQLQEYRLETVLRVQAKIPFVARLTSFETADLEQVVSRDTDSFLQKLKATAIPYWDDINLLRVIVEATQPPNTEDEQSGSSASTLPPLPTNANTCNGLENLCDVRVNDVLFATMHNANNAGDESSSLLIAPNHERDLLQGLRAGIRGLNMDLGKCRRADGTTELVLVHGNCALGYTDPVRVFGQIQQFLTDNPREVVLLPIQINDDTGGTVQLNEMDELLQKVVDTNGKSMKDRLYAHPRWEDTTVQPERHPWPTLQTMIDTDQRIVFMHYNGAEAACLGNSENCPLGFHDYFLYSAETYFQFDTVQEIAGDRETSCNVTRGGRGFRDFFGINVFLEIPSQPASMTLNRPLYLKEHVEACSVQNEMPPNLISIDFWSAASAGVIQMVQAYNARLQPDADGSAVIVAPSSNSNNNDGTTGSSSSTRFPLDATDVSQACSRGTLQVDDGQRCREACEPQFSECCNPFEDKGGGDNSDNDECRWEEEIPGCVAYSKCQALNQEIDPAPSSLPVLCSEDQLNKDPTSCQELCQHVQCCYDDGNSNCLASNFEICMDYAPCQNLRKGYIVPTARTDLDIMCSWDQPECQEECQKAMCCGDPDSLCLQTNFVSCLTYAPCNNNLVNTALEIAVAPQYSVVPSVSDQARQVCEDYREALYTAPDLALTLYDPCVAQCRLALCCWEGQTNDNCFFEDPLGCLAWEEYCQVLFE